MVVVYISTLLSKQFEINLVHYRRMLPFLPRIFTGQRHYMQRFGHSFFFGINYKTIKQEKGKKAMASCLVCYGSRCPGKSRWQELVGMKASEAKKIMERENP